MTILIDSANLVKPRNFGRGILRTLPTYRRTWSDGDEAALIEDNARRDAENRRIDRHAAEAVTLDRLVNGYGI